MPPKAKRKVPTATTTPASGTPVPDDLLGVGEASSASLTPQPLALSLSLSYLHTPKPFKNPYYAKHINRRAKTMKMVMNGEREKAKLERERRKAVKENDDGMEVDSPTTPINEEELETMYISLTAPPSILPTPHYCDITGLDGPYTDPATKLRYHDRSVYEIVKSLNPSFAREYLSARGAAPIVK